jgi:hypothetical protein
MEKKESEKQGVKPRGKVVLILSLLLGIGIIIGLVKLFAYANRRTVNPVAQNTAVELAQGIKQFRQEYGRWPVIEGEKHQSDATLLVNLIGYDTRINKRGINFMRNIGTAKGSPPINGLHRTGDTGEVFDPWGNLFVVTLDHDNDGWVENPEGPSGQGGARLNLKVAVVSPGRDGVVSGKNREGKDATKDNWRSW